MKPSPDSRPCTGHATYRSARVLLFNVVNDYESLFMMNTRRLFIEIDRIWDLQLPMSRIGRWCFGSGAYLDFYSGGRADEHL